jgi:aspartate/methionine/tyrosine aminotransferase
VDDEHAFVEALRQKRVVVTPGSTFGSLGKDYVRISYASSFDKLKQAFEIMKELVA